VEGWLLDEEGDMVEVEVEDDKGPGMDGDNFVAAVGSIVVVVVVVGGGGGGGGKLHATKLSPYSRLSVESLAVADIVVVADIDVAVVVVEGSSCQADHPSSSYPAAALVVP